MASRLFQLTSPFGPAHRACQLRLLARQQPFTTGSSAYTPASPVVKAASTVDAPYVKGTINDPTTFPPPNKAHGSVHWTFERSVAVALIPITAATAIVSPNPMLDGLLGVTLVAHSHMGFDQARIDYLPDRKFPIIGPTARWTLRALACGALVGIYQFNTHDIGLTELIKKTWKA